MEPTIETVYEENEDEETATRRVRVIPDYDYTPGDCLGGGMATLNYVNCRDKEKFLSSLNNHESDYTEEVLTTGGIIFDGSVYWIAGPSDRDGDYFFSFESRKDAKEYGKFAYEDMKEYLDGSAVGLIYEEKVSHEWGDEWEDQDSLWGIVGYNEKYALEYLNQHVGV